MMNWIDIATLFFAIISAIFGFIIWRTERAKELSTLKALYQHIKQIKKSITDHRKQIIDKSSKNPSWPISNIDLNYYLSNIKYKVRKEMHLCCREPTKELKDELIKIYDKICTLNYNWERLNKNKDTDIGDGRYHDNLHPSIENCLKEIKRIVKFYD